MESCVLIAHSGASAENDIIQTEVQLTFLYLYFSHFFKSVNRKLDRGKDAIL